MSHWTDSIIGERMAVDQAFADRVRASQFSNAEWDLIMTATTLEMTNAEDPEAARIVANTDNVAGVIPELDTIRSQTAALAGQSAERTHGSNGDSSIRSSRRLDSVVIPMATARSIRKHWQPPSGSLRSMPRPYRHISKTPGASSRPEQPASIRTSHRRFEKG